jgi:hypothetical protein
VRLERSIAAYLTERIPGLHPFKDEIAFVAAGNPYPYFLIDLISTRRKAVGTGVWDQTVLQEGVRIATKAVSVHQVLRFTVRAANMPQKNGNAVVGEICDQIEALLTGLSREGPADLPDPLGGTLHLERVVFQGRYDLPPIEKGMPFVYQQALTFLFVEQQIITRQVEGKIDRIRISITD